MSSFNRKQMYGLLYNRPLFCYAIGKPDGTKLIRVLVIGDDSISLEVFRSVYWCAQMTSDYGLSVTIASNSPKTTKSLFNAEMPALNGNLIPAEISFTSISEACTNSDTCYSCIFVAEESVSANELCKRLLNQRAQFPARAESKLLICLCCEAEPSSAQYTDVSGQMIEQYSFSMNWDMRDLERYAYNSDFAYSLGLDERTKKPSILDFQSAENVYRHDSSFAFAVHIPYKMRICTDQEGGNEKVALAALSKAIGEHAAGKDSYLYDQLLELEHRRWAAYMISNGWQMPTDDVLISYAYQFGNDHRLKSKKLHPCLCLASDKGSLLRQYYELWDSNYTCGVTSVSGMMELLKSSNRYSQLTELDAVSLVLHNIAVIRAEEALRKHPIREMFAFIEQLGNDGEIKAFENLRQSVCRMRDDEPNAIKLYHAAMKEARAQSERMNDNALKDSLSTIEETLSIVEKRNEKIDYFGIDSVMVDMIPFCLWYGEKYKTIITFGSGIPAEDVKVPAILSAEKAIFLCKGAISKQYSTAIKSFFENSRGGYTKTVFKSVPSDVDGIAKNIDELMCEDVGAVINWTSSDDAATAMAIGIAYNRPYMPVFYFDSKAGITDIKNGNIISNGLARRSLSVDEFALLMGGEYRNVYKNIGSLRDYKSFEGLFFQYLAERQYETNGKRVYRSPWNSLSNFFQSVSKDETPNFVAGKIWTYPQKHTCCINTRVFYGCGISQFLNALSDYRIIGNYSYEVRDNLTNISFDYVDKKLLEILAPYEIQRIDTFAGRDLPQMQLKFIPKLGIVVSNTHVECAQLVDQNDSEQFASDKVTFVQKMDRLGLIKNLQFIEDGKSVSFDFKSLRTMQMFKTQGKIFELVLYTKFRNSGLFDDVQTSVQICWDMNTKSEEALILDRVKNMRGIGYQLYDDAKKEVREDVFNGRLDSGTINEIDIVLTCGMTPIFVSCKTGKSGWNDWLNEISSLSQHFHSRALLAVTKDLDLPESKAFRARARKMGVSIIGMETFLDDAQMSNAIQALCKGKIVIGKEFV